jgi:hypothetical protein
MGQRGLSLLLGSALVVVVFGSAIWLARTVEGLSDWWPPGSDALRVQMPNAAELQLRYRLPRGLAWSTVYSRLTNQGWVLKDDELLVWPDLLNDGHTAAVFWRSGWLRLGRQRLTVRRDTSVPQRFIIEITQCVGLAPAAPCA